MSFRAPGLGRRLGTGRTRVMVPVLVALVVLLVAFLVFTSMWTNLLWYRSVDFSSVYTTQLRTKVLLFFGSGLLMALVVGANIVIAFRLRPAYRPLSVEQQNLERYRGALDQHRRLIAIGLLGLIGLLTGSSMSGQWKTWLAFMNRTSFGVKDPQFHKDISFYVFTYPFLRMILSFVVATVILCIVVAVIVHYLYGGLRLQGPGDKASPPARAHLSVLVGLFVLLKAFAYWTDRWGLANSTRGQAHGPSYVDVNAVLPAKTILAIIAMICAALFFVNIWRRGMMLPGVGFGLMVLSAILIGGVYPLLIQQFQVRPNERDKEARYIQRSIDSTRKAYGVDTTQVSAYGTQPESDAVKLRTEAEKLSGVRLLDPGVVGPTFQQLQQGRNFYKFPDSLDVDRYRLNNQPVPQDSVVAVRELEGAPAGQRGWVNDHMIYTHGYGFVGAYGERIAANGVPDFIEKDMPPTGQLQIARPEVYFGERSRSYSVVGGSGQQELDYPDDSPTGQKDTTYKGGGGVPIDSFMSKLLFSVKFQEKNLLLSGAIKKDARILYNRSPREMVQRAAPWLTLDGDPYPVVVDGRIKWVVDGYTSSNGYPYSESVGLGDATRDTLTDTRSAVTRQSDDHINYIRNSVKATVDAYDGTVQLYQWDQQDPIVKTWMKAFPGTVQPSSKIPPQLLEHLRFPQDLFKVQRTMLARYHVEQAAEFYGGQGFWEVPQDPNPVNKGKTQPPYYLTLGMPGEPNPRFSLTSVYTPKGRPNLAAFLAVDANPGPGYGRLRLLEMPSSSQPGRPQPQGPGQVQNTFESNDAVKKVLNDLRLGGTETKLGNLLTLPFGGGLLYAEPVYAQSAQTQQEPYPILRYILLMYGDRIAVSTTLQDALNQLFKGSSVGGSPTTGGGAGGGQLSAEAQQAIADAQKAFNEGQAALSKQPQDWAAYGEAQKGLKDALDRLAKAQQQGAKKSPG